MGNALPIVLKTKLVIKTTGDFILLARLEKRNVLYHRISRRGIPGRAPPARDASDPLRSKTSFIFVEHGHEAPADSDPPHRESTGSRSRDAFGRNRSKCVYNNLDAVQSNGWLHSPMAPPWT